MTALREEAREAAKQATALRRWVLTTACGAGVSLAGIAATIWTHYH